MQQNAYFTRARRRNEAIRMRTEGLTYAAIAERLDIKPSSAYVLVNGRRDKTKPPKRRTAERVPGISPAKLPLVGRTDGTA